MTDITLAVSFRPGLGWVLRNDSAGPGGAAHLNLDGAEIAVDLLDPQQLVEWLVPALAPDEPLPVEALGLLADCFGPIVVDALDAGAAGEERSVRVQPRLPWELLGRCALEATLAGRRPALAGLDVVAVAGSATDPLVIDEMRRRAWDMVPPLGALGLAAGRDSDVLDTMAQQSRVDLRERVAAVLDLIGDEPEFSGAEPVIRNLVDLLTPVTAIPIELLQLPVATAGTGPFRGPSPGLSGPALVVEDCSAEDLRADLGRAALDAFAGVTVQDDVPGQIRLRFPLRPDTDLALYRSITVNVLSWDGTVLAQEPLRVNRVGNGLPIAECRLAVAPSEVHGVVVDFAVYGRPAPDREQLLRTARHRAGVAARAAMIAHRRGEARAAIDAWDRCARLLEAVGQLDAASRARAEAEQLEGPLTRDWLAELEVRWTEVASRSLDGGDLDDVLVTARDLAVCFPASDVLAKLYQRAADRLDASDDSDDQDEAEARLRAAMAVWLARGDETRAGACLRRLNARPRVD